MRWKVLVSAPYFQPVIDRFRQVFEEHDIELVLPKVNERMSENELTEIIDDIDGVISGDDQFTSRVFEKAKRLRVISKWGTGIDSIDQVAAKKFGVKVCNTPNAFTMPVADSVMGYVLCFARRIPWMDRDIRAKNWVKQMGVSLQEKTLGVIGVGDVGKAVVRRAIAFNMRVLGTDIVELPADFLVETKIEVVTKEELLRQADFVSINCTLDKTSYHIIDSKAIGLMKSTAYLINTARGPLVDEKALVEALRGQQIAGAALDVFEQEPLPEGSPLREMDNCLLAPHNANSSPTAWERVHASTLKNLLEGLGLPGAGLKRQYA